MFKKTSLDLKRAGVLSKLVLDYLNKQETLRPFYGPTPDEAGFAQLLKDDPYKNFDRRLLTDILLRQARSVENTSEETIATIQSLTSKNTFTVTTGHQLCLFTGPSYFIYKIFSTINLAEQLRKKFPQQHFVPVYWMASEDHDFEEVNHFHALGKTISWKSQQGGAVGHFQTEELKKLFPAIQELFGRSERADYLSNLFEAAYLKHKNLSDATRFLVNALFGAYSLIVLDGDDPGFKQQFKAEFKKDIFQSSQHGLVNQSIAALEKLGYSAQVNPRPVNCFYIEEGARMRLEKSGERFNLVGTKRSFTARELENIINDHPEKISPNVVLRPAYQQVILPNLAYVGGPGELAYWLEFKAMFDASGILFPVLMPRNFVMIIDKLTESKIEKLNFSPAELYQEEQALIKMLQVKKEDVFDLASEKEELSELYSKILERVSATDKTLSGSVSAELQRALNGFERIIGKTNRAIRRKYETEINQLSSIRQRLFPKAVPQERYENFASFYLNYGDAFFKVLKEQADPFVFEQIVFVEG